MLRQLIISCLLCILQVAVLAQDTTTVPTPDSVQVYHPDSSLRIINLNPFFTLHVDSSLTYQLQINKNPEQYFWYLRNSPVGLRINKDNGTLSFRADKSFFLSGKLKYDVNYRVNLGVQNLSDPKEKVDTSFTIVFYNTEIIPSEVKPTVSGTVTVDEGEEVRFRLLCENGSFPIDNILMMSSTPLGNYTEVKRCDDEFRWLPSYDFVREGKDSANIRIVNLSFIGSTRFQVRDTANVRIVVRNSLNYPLAKTEYEQVVKNIQVYILKLKYTFLVIDKRLKKTRGARTSFDLTSATTSLTGTILSTTPNGRNNTQTSAQRVGKVLPSVGLSMVPIKEAAVPARPVDQNQAALIRASIKRLEYILPDNMLLGERDWDIVRKTNKLRDELKAVQVQLIDVPVEITNNLSEEELNRYFNSPKVTKKYRLKAR